MDANVVPEAQLRARYIPKHHVPSLGFIGTLIEVYILLKSSHLPLSVMWALSWTLPELCGRKWKANQGERSEPSTLIIWV